MPHSGNTTIPSEREPRVPAPREPEIALTLLIIWSAREKDRAGEIAFVHADKPYTLGRGAERKDTLRFARQQPADLRERPPLIGESLSREQLRLTLTPKGLLIENKGSAKLLVNGVLQTSAIVVPGDVVEIRGHYAFLVTTRLLAIAPTPLYSRSSHPFGEADAHGILGESPAAWGLRRAIGAASKAASHVLILGESGTGKELAAQAIHALSPRAHRPIVARNAATFPPGLVDAELFGNAKNYPHAGMPERAGMVGEAEGGTLFLDEIGELPHEAQASLLRMLDRNGEHTRLGDAKPRRADVRLVCATNRPRDSLKHDFAARLATTVHVPPLGARRCDIPLLVRALILQAARESPGIAEMFVDTSGKREEILIDAALITYLVQRPYHTHVRELEALLMAAMIAAEETPLTLTDAIASSHLAGQTPSEAPHSPNDALVSADDAANDASIPRAKLVDALEKNRWRQLDAARALGVSRHAIARAMQKHGLANRGR